MRVHVSLPDALIALIDVRASADFAGRSATICRLLALALRAESAHAPESAPPRHAPSAPLAVVHPLPLTPAEERYQRELAEHLAAVEAFGDHAGEPPEPPPPRVVHGPRPAWVPAGAPDVPDEGLTWGDYREPRARTPRR